MRDMYLPYLQRHSRFAISVTFASGAVRTYGPIGDRQEAIGFLRSRLLAPGDMSPRAEDILAAQVIRTKRMCDYSQAELLGRRLRLPA